MVENVECKSTASAFGVTTDVARDVASLVSNSQHYPAVRNQQIDAPAAQPTASSIQYLRMYSTVDISIQCASPAVTSSRIPVNHHAILTTEILQQGESSLPTEAHVIPPPANVMTDLGFSFR